MARYAASLGDVVMTTDFVIRDAQGNDDADAIAAVHAASWRATYRGILSDAYLDGPIDQERRELWRARFADDVPPTVVACAGDAVVGFACAFANEDARWGSRIDNLHVLPNHKRRGLATRLMRAVAGRLEALAPSVPVYLWVYEVNHTARATYESLGGQLTEHGSRTGADGTATPALRYTWPSPSMVGAEAASKA